MRISHFVAGMACLGAFEMPAHAPPAAAPQPSLADTVVARYCAAWGTVDRAAREALLAEVWAERIPPPQLAFVISLQFTDTRGTRVFETMTVPEALPRNWQIF